MGYFILTTYNNYVFFFCHGFPASIELTLAVVVGINTRIFVRMEIFYLGLVLVDLVYWFSTCHKMFSIWKLQVDL